MPETITPPSGLSEEAANLWRDVVRERGDRLTPEREGALLQACRLISLADRCEAAMADALVVEGYKGQPVPNGLLTEARHARAAAVAALRSSGLFQQGAASEAGRALANKRHHGLSVAR